MSIARKTRGLRREAPACLNMPQETSTRQKPRLQQARHGLDATGMSHLVIDSVTVFPADARGRAAIAASHGGVYAAYLAAKAGVKAVILCDAGVGRERAGIGGLDYFEKLGVPAAALRHRTARIGNGADCARRGVITFANSEAANAGVVPGMSAREALDRIGKTDLPP